MEYMYIGLIFSLIIINLISWIFFQKYHRKAMQEELSTFDETLKRIEVAVSLLNRMVTDNKTILSELPGESYHEKLRVEFLQKNGSLLKEIKSFSDNLIKRLQQVEVTPQEIERQIPDRPKILEDKIEELERPPTPGKKIEEPLPQEGITLKAEKEMTEIGNLLNLKEEQRVSAPSPHQVLKEILMEYDTISSVREILKELELIKSEGFSKKLLRELLDVYFYYYHSELNNLSTALENTLKSNYGLKFTHAQIGFNASSAVGFDKIRKEETFRLESFEREKIEHKGFEQENRDTILFELCPQVRFKDELILKGKIIVS